MAPETRYFATARGEIRGLLWGAAGAPLLIMVHGAIGLAENFLELGAAFGKSHRVVALDLPGRGHSYWAGSPQEEYRFSSFVESVESIADTLAAHSIRWVGTSLGGALGIRAAGGRLRGRISHLVLNDIGPTLPEHLVPGLRAALAAQPVFSSLEELATSLAEGIGALAAVPRDKTFWRNRAAHYCRRLPDGRFTLHHDPRTEVHFAQGRSDLESWEAFRAIEANVMVLHAARSQVLTGDIVTAMRAAQPQLVVAEYHEWGHAPFLDTAQDYQLIADFLMNSGVAKGS